MEQAEGPGIKSPEIQDKDQLRVAQRQVILHDHFKNPSKLELLTGLIPSDRPSPNTAVDEAGLRHLAEALGKNTHTVLFDLAATSKNPVELYNIILNISNLKKVESSYWKFEDSEDQFLKRKLPENINVSEEVENQTGANGPNPQHILESFFYSLSTENVPLEDKKRMLEDFYSSKALMSAPSGNEDHQRTYGSESSFWSHVDGSWIDPKLTPKEHTGRSKKAIVASSIANGIRDRLKRSEAATQNAAPAADAVPSRVAPQPDEQSVQSQDLGGLTEDQLMEKAFEITTRGITLGKRFTDLKNINNPSASQLEEMIDLRGQLVAIQPEIEIIGREFERLDELKRKASEKAESPTPVATPPAPEGTTAARGAPRSHEQNDRPEDLSKKSVDDLTELLHENNTRAMYLHATLINASGADKDQIDREIKDIGNNIKASLLELESRLTPTEFTAIKKRLIDRLLEPRAQEKVKPPTPAARPKDVDVTPSQNPWLKTDPALNRWPWPADKPSEAQSVNTPKVDPRLERILRYPDQQDKENIVELGTGDKDLVQELNEKLKEQVTDNATFAVSPNVLKDYLTSMAQGMAKGGSIEIWPNNVLLIHGLHVEKEVEQKVFGKSITATAKATVEISMQNNRLNDGIEAKLKEYKGNNVANIGGAARKAAGGRGVREEIEHLLADLNTTVKTNLNKQIDSEANPLWHTDTILISGDKVNIKFNRAAQPRPR